MGGKSSATLKPKSPEPRRGGMGALDAIEEEADDAKRAETAALQVKRLTVGESAAIPEDKSSRGDQDELDDFLLNDSQGNRRPKAPTVSQLEVKDGSESSGFSSSFATSSEDSESERPPSNKMSKISKKSKSKSNKKPGILRKTTKFGTDTPE